MTSEDQAFYEDNCQGQYIARCSNTVSRDWLKRKERDAERKISDDAKRQHMAEERRTQQRLNFQEMAANLKDCETQGAHKEARNISKPRCNSTYCTRNGLGCEMVTDDRRASILSTFYGLVSLCDQRLWILRHIKSRKTSTSKENSRKTRTVAFFLLLDDNGGTVRVCRFLFLNTINVTDRQVSTVLIKTSSTGAVEQEKEEVVWLAKLLEMSESVEDYHKARIRLNVPIMKFIREKKKK
ncbi:hypothetical protein LOTGIDRAFT_162044 [Lottia gigantea]|uniref:Uncharacterized protein n=1 Tax=Lottia gigantea TaxID=225164 RepID=V4AD41_LOTGI|nr:hypothetical protein LOTGIDRAFT_162044 [Lottia gigantea]ESO93020.1 hypothetical protein LOTGIDRAFT_162044 [Lottia gigantea]